MNLGARAGAVARQWALGLGVGVAVLAVALAGLGFLVAAFYLYAAQHMDAERAAALTGGVLLALAVLIGAGGAAVLRKIKKPQPGLLSDLGGTLGLGIRLAGLLVRRDPRKAIIIAAVSGALAEYILSDRKK